MKHCRAIDVLSHIYEYLDYEDSYSYSIVFMYHCRNHHSPIFDCPITMFSIPKYNYRCVRVIDIGTIIKHMSYSTFNKHFPNCDTLYVDGYVNLDKWKQIQYCHITNLSNDLYVSRHMKELSIDDLEEWNIGNYDEEVIKDIKVNMYSSNGKIKVSLLDTKDKNVYVDMYPDNGKIKVSLMNRDSYYHKVTIIHIKNVEKVVLQNMMKKDPENYIEVYIESGVDKLYLLEINNCIDNFIIDSPLKELYLYAVWYSINITYNPTIPIPQVYSEINNFGSIVNSYTILYDVESPLNELYTLSEHLYLDNIAYKTNDTQSMSSTESYKEDDPRLYDSDHASDTDSDPEEYYYHIKHK